jgi:hypothetical protein
MDGAFEAILPSEMLPLSFDTFSAILDRTFNVPVGDDDPLF